MDRACRTNDPQIPRRLVGVGLRDWRGHRMVDQADVKPTNGRDEGRSELPPRAVARSTGEFLHDVTTLAELQGKLLLVESKQGLTKLVMPIALLVLGVVIALGCVPIALAALAITLVQAAEFS